ncbi:MAG: NAD-dependent epimerase/dehydratase family protein [Nitrospirae bacterium]|nr:NAD-dependent epimerase/dehydratase family protein [Nitrospirota bacterium]
MNLKGKRVFITGGAGFVGSHIADLLLKEDVSEIRIIDNLLRGRIENIEGAMRSGKVKFVEGDIRDKSLIDELTEGTDIVFHQAALRITRCAEGHDECIDVMVGGTLNVLNACLRHKVKKIIAASSASVYGLADEFPTEESHHPYNNRTLYGACKSFNELMLRSFYDMYGLSYAALRYFNVYGPRMDIHGVYTEVMIRWLDRIDAGEPPLIFGDGSQTMDFIFIEDVARANILAAKSDVTDNVFNVASGKETSLLELLNLFLKVKGSELKPEFREERKVNPVGRRLASTKKAEKLLGFRAEVGLEEGLQRLVEWKAGQS